MHPQKCITQLRSQSNKAGSLQHLLHQQSGHFHQHYPKNTCITGPAERHSSRQHSCTVRLSKVHHSNTAHQDVPAYPGSQAGWFYMHTYIHIYPSNHYLSLLILCRVTGGQSNLSLTLSEMRDTHWAGFQFIRGLTYTATHTYQQTAPTSYPNLRDFGAWEDAGPSLWEVTALIIANIYHIYYRWQKTTYITY